MSTPYQQGRAVLLFAKAPIAGQVKTRLIPVLGPAGAAALHRRLLVELSETLALNLNSILELWCAPDAEHPVFQDLATRYTLPLYVQTGADLGDRMLRAAEDALSRHTRVVLIGADCPLITPELLEQTFTWLAEPQDAVLGPAEDGGYVLIGMNRVHPLLFSDMPWGTDRVAEETRRRLLRLGWTWREHQVLWDVDRPADLLRLESQSTYL